MAKQAHLHDGTILEFPDETSDDVIDRVVKSHIAKPEQPQDIGMAEKAKNAMYGFAARGNQAMAALNPFADMDKIKAEQEWVKRHSGAGVGQMLADMAMTAPAAGPASAGLRALTAGAIEASTQPGSVQDKERAMLSGTAGAALGEGAASALGYLAKPFADKADPVFQALRDKAKQIMPLNAAQQTGNKALQYIDSALDFIPSSSGIQQANKDAQREAWQRAIFEKGHEYGATQPTQDALAAMRDRIQAAYRGVAGRNEMVVDAPFKQAMSDVEQNLMGRIPTNQKSIVKSYLQDFNTAPQGAFIKGDQYQEIRSMLDKQAKAFRNTDPATSEALKQIRNSADAAMERSVSPEDYAKLMQANNDWSVLKAIEANTNPTTAQINAQTMINGLRRQDPNRVMYGKGNQDLTDLAKVGRQFISDQTRDSGTAQRQAMIKLLSGAGAGGAAEEFYRTRDPGAAATGAAASTLAALLIPKQAAKMMWRPNGYLSQGIADLSAPIVQNLTKQRLIAEILRNVGVQTGESIGGQ